MKKVERDKFFESQEVQHILKSLKKVATVRDYFLMEMLFNTGLRINTCLSLNVGDVRAKDHAFVISKGGKLGRVVFNSKLIKSIRKFITWKRSNGEPTKNDDALFVSKFKKRLGYHGVVVLLRKYRKKINDPIWKRFLKIHCTRHSYASALVNAEGGGVVVARDALFHSSIQVTNAYVHTTDDQLQKAAELVKF